jgi:Flp pilus assembly pilin Flp
MQNATTTMAVGCGLIGFLVAKAIIATVQFFGVNLAASYTAITNALL